MLHGFSCSKSTFLHKFLHNKNKKNNTYFYNKLLKKAHCVSCGSVNYKRKEDDNSNKVNAELDVVAVRRPTKSEDCGFDAFDKELGELVYEREEVETMTLEDVCKALGKKIEIVESY